MHRCLIVICLLSMPAAAAERKTTENRPTGPAEEQLGPGRPVSPLAAPDAPEPPIPVDALISRSVTLLAQGGESQVKTAHRLLRLALKSRPDSAPIHIGLARAEAALYSRRWMEDDGLIGQVLEHADRAAELAPDRPEPHAARAMGLMLSGRWRDARGASRHAWEIATASAPAWIAQAHAQALIGQARPEAALEVIDAALEERPDLPGLYAIKGAALMESGKETEAMQELEKALFLDDELTPARVLMARAYDQAGNRRMAGEIYKEVVRRAPEEKGRVYTLMAITLISRQRYAEALRGLDEIRFKTSVGLGQGTVHFLRGACQEGLGRADKARKEYRKVIEEYPAASYGSYSSMNLASSSYEALARLEMKAGRMDEAARIMEEAMKEPRPNLTLFLRLAALYTHYDLHEEARKILKQAAAVDFGPRQAGAKVTLYVAWARASRELAGEPGSYRDAEVLEALEAHRDSLLASGELNYLVEASRAAAVAGDPHAALEWLGLAVDRGYSSLAWIAEDEEMEAVAHLAAFGPLADRARER